MLILTRKIGEKLRINDDIEVVVLGVKHGQVRLGVEAPKDVSVHREEIYQRIQEDKEQPVCKGDMMLGTGCGKCERCLGSVQP